jgi:hypothetical protein
MNSGIAERLLGLSLAGAMLLPGPTRGAVPPVVLSAENEATSVWDTDPSKVGIELQIVNNGASPATDVQVSSIVVEGGSLNGPATLPIALGTIKPAGSALLDLVITVPRTDGTRYLLTISGTYAYSGGRHGFSVDRAVAPNTTAPGPLFGRSGVSGKSSDQSPGPAPNPPSTASPPFGPNATTPILIPPGPPRRLSVPGADQTESTSKTR